jgi:eukaryotic-like serine/threonine-protein kinase
MIGKTLGHYRVGEQLSRGGMGEVYLADDLNLNRKIALKFLPEAFAAGPEGMARFKREAKLLASLNRPNNAAIRGFEQAEGKRFLVLELVESKLLSGPLLERETVRLTIQIATARPPALPSPSAQNESGIPERRMSHDSQRNCEVFCHKR